MKRILITIILTFAFCGVYSQDWEFETINYNTHPGKSWEYISDLMLNNIMRDANVDASGNISYEKIVSSTASKQDIMSYCRIFISQHYERADVVIEIDDVNVGVIIGKALYHQFRIDAADGKAKISISTKDYVNLNSFIKKNGKLRGSIYHYYNNTHRVILYLLYDFGQFIENKGYTEI